MAKQTLFQKCHQCNPYLSLCPLSFSSVVNQACICSCLRCKCIFDGHVLYAVAALYFLVASNTTVIVLLFKMLFLYDCFASAVSIVQTWSAIVFVADEFARAAKQSGKQKIFKFWSGSLLRYVVSMLPQL